MLLPNLKKTVARVDVGDRPSGTAFLIAHDRIVTALHVLAGCKQVNLVFVAWPDGERERVATLDWRHPAGHDLAILTLDRPCPADVHPILWSPASPPWNARWSTFGFPSQVRNGHALVDEEIKDPEQQILEWDLTVLQLHATAAAYDLRGLSGAPCIVAGVIVGIITHQLRQFSEDGVATEKSTPALNTLYALPLALLVDAGIAPPRFVLADHPDHTLDWTCLDARSKRDAGQVADAIAGRVRIPRDGSLTALTNALVAHEFVALLGASGCGKSAVVKALLERRTKNNVRTLWVDARSLDCVDFGLFESALRLQHPLADLLGSTASADPILILDGLDRLYSENAFRHAATLLRLARQDAPATPWRVVAPCQSLEWPRVLEALQRAGAIGGAWKQLQLEPLKTSELKPVSDALPALARLLLQPKVCALLTNLKLLDLVARQVDAGANIDPSGWVGELSVAHWFWDAEIDRGADRITRGKFARALAQRQADELVASVPTDEFATSDLAPLPSLVADQLCLQVSGDRIAFAHDLYGDWARLRILSNYRGDLPAFFRGRHESPLWHRALRLLGIHLLEHSGAVDDWRAVLSAFDQCEFGILRDVLLEAPVFAANARVLLDAVLPDLLPKKGRLLRRLLTRFLAFGTVPKREMVAVAVSVGVDPSVARATYRRPHWPLWLDVLAFLHTHRAVVLPVVPSEVSQLVEMWLDFAPPGSVRRAEAAELAVLLGQHALTTRGVRGGRECQPERERFYACTLAAVHEHIDDVVAIALSASERRTSALVSSDAPPSPACPRRSGMFGTPRVMRDPWPDGPHARVDEAFQNVVLDSTAIMDLFRVRPDAAREVLLANLIQEPSEKDWNYDLMRRVERGIVRRYKWVPPLYTHGPFLGVLRENFAEGLEVVARLVEFTVARERELTERRVRTTAEERAEEPADGLKEEALCWQVIVVDADRTRAFSGDLHVYGWSAGLGNPPDAVQCALMALEQYFYQRLDEGQDITSEVSAVLARSESVALLGVLCDVGKRHQPLFEGPLRTLLSAPEFYEWELRKAAHGRSHLMIGWFNQGEWFIKLAQQFHGLEHRQVDLRHTAILLMLQQPAMREYFDRVRAVWSLESASTGNRSEMRQQLLVSLDPGNYEVREDPEHGTVLVNVEALRVHEARSEQRRAMEDHMLVTTFPTRCRTILDERRQLDEKQIAELWDQWRLIRELSSAEAEPTNGDDYKRAIAGGVAVFMWHAEWSTSRLPELVEALREALSAPPEQRFFDSDDSVVTWTFECFAAEAVAMLWAREPRSEEWRRLVAKAVFARRYVTTRVLFARCAELRRTLGEDFSRLRRLSLEWAYMRERVELLQHVARAEFRLDGAITKRMHQNLVDWADERVEAFVSAAMPGMPVVWEECDNAHRFPDLEDAYLEWAGHPGLDIRVVRCAHEWLCLPNEAKDVREREDIIQFWRSALNYAIARLRTDPSRQGPQYPQEDERWILERVGPVLLQMRADEEPERLWRPVLDLHGEGHDWPDLLARSLHRHALRAEQTPSAYAALVRAMSQRAFVDLDGESRWSSFDSVWDALIGVDQYSRDLWEQRHAGIVRDLQDVFIFWMQRVPCNGRRLGGFASWLSRPPASLLRLQALRWMLRVLREERRGRDVEGAEDAIAGLLNVVWSEEESGLRGDLGAFDAFRGLLGWLGTRQNRLGLELLGRLGSLT